MHLKLTKTAFVLTLAACCAFGLSLTFSQPAHAALPACSPFACGPSATVGNVPCDYTDSEGTIWRCFRGTQRSGPFLMTCHGNCYGVPL